jgi:oligogalacturonide lyase
MYFLKPLMKHLSLLGLALAFGGLALRAADYPRSWIDPDTGHRVVQLSTEPGSAGLYFTQYSFTAGGTKLLVMTPGGIDLVTVSTGETEHVYQGLDAYVVQTGRKTGSIFYAKADGFLYVLDPATRTSRQVAKLPPHGSFRTINADETLVAGVISEREPMEPGGLSYRPPPPGSYKAGEVQKGNEPPDKHDRMEQRLSQHLPMTLFTVNLQTGEYHELLHTTDWLNHLQFSPTDPSLLMYCHEGPWERVDRIWLLRVDGQSPSQLIHQRTMKMEVAGHEYWSNDGQWIWYDLQRPRPEDFWVAGYQLATGRRLWYHLDRNQWSLHYNSSADGTLFSGDGSDPAGTAKTKNGKWMFLYRPELIPDLPGETPDQEHMIQVGKFAAERLVSLSTHDYSIEPNGQFSPDGKWVVFRSNMHGPIQVFAVEVAKTN